MTSAHPPTLRDVFVGLARFRAITAWGPWSALAAVLAMAAVIAVLQIFGLGFVGKIIGAEAYKSQVATGTLASPVMLISTLLTQLPLIAMLWLAAGRGGLRRETLQLAQRPPSWFTALLMGVALTCVLAALQVVLHLSVPGYELSQEARSFAAGLKSPLWLGTVLAIGFLAPLSEELLARGFLLTALANSKLGILGAGLISNVLWTSLHFQYSWGSLFTVFTGGVLLAWLVWRTGSMRAAVVAHTVVNLTLLGYLAAMGAPA